MSLESQTPMSERQSAPARSALLQHAPCDSARGVGLRITPSRRPKGTTYGPASILGIAALLWSLVFGTATLCAAILTPPPAAAPPIQMQPGASQPPPSELPKIVAELAAQPALSAADCARLARETITFGESTRQSRQPVKPGIVNDGLAAVDQGEAADPKIANWPELRARLQDLLKPPPPKQDEKKEEEKKDEQQKQQDQQKEQQKPQEQKQEQRSPEQKKPEQQKKEQEQEQEKTQQTQQPDKPEPPKDTQSVGGEKPKDDERKEHPELAVPLQKLDQVRDKDSPAELFQLLHNDEPQPPDQPRKDW